MKQNRSDIIPFHQNKLSFRIGKNLRVSAYAFSETGDRPVNEDSIFSGSFGQSGCFVLADGLGGHGMGDEASALAVDVASSSFFEKEEWKDSDTAEIFQAAQDMIISEHQLKNISGGMKTTLSFLAVNGTTAGIGWIGDSRVYWFRTNKSAKRKANRFFKKHKVFGVAPLKKRRKESYVEYYFEGGRMCRTSDHSIPQGQFECGEIEEREIRHHSKRGFLISALGDRWDGNIAMEGNSKPYELWKQKKVKEGDAFLLCSDGFWELIEEEEMMHLLETSISVEEWLHSMKTVVDENAGKQRAKAEAEGKNWSMDNNSAIAVWIS